MTILGSLVLHSDRDVPEFSFSELTGLQKREGHHVSGRWNGSYREYFDCEPLEIMVPQRYKRMSVLTDSPIKHELADALSTLDSQYGDARQVFKINMMSQGLEGSWRATVNISNSGADGNAMSGAFYLLARNSPLYVCLVLDAKTGSVQLVWADFDVKHALQTSGQFNYSVFSMPTLIRRPLFVPSQALCSKWWRMSQSLCQTKYGLLRACNAVELMLYKNPNISSL